MATSPIRTAETMRGLFMSSSDTGFYLHYAPASEA
jgi:hypothetical protein